MSDDLDNNLDFDGSFDEFAKKGNSLGDLWRSNPMVKIGVVVVVAVVVFALIMVFGGQGKETSQSSLHEATDVTSAPGTEEASPAYVQAVEEVNAARVEEAIKEGTSALPVPIEPPVGVISTPEQTEETEDPLERWRRLQEERLQKEVQQRQEVAPDTEVEDTAKAEAIAALAGTMSTQMTSILANNTQTTLNTLNLTDSEFLVKLHAVQQAEQKDISGSDLTEGDGTGEVLFPAGEVVYAQILTEANTDVPGPVLGEIMSGPFRGSRILGTFEENNELITLNFDTMILNGETISIDAVALDPDTTLAGMATDVDHHYLQKIVLPAASAFVEGLSEAISESGLTTVTISGQTGTTTTETQGETSDKQEFASGIEEAAGKVTEIIDEMADDAETTVIIRAGTPFGLLFIEPVVKTETGQVSDIPADIGIVPATSSSAGFEAPTKKTSKHVFSSPVYYNMPSQKKNKP